MAKKIASVFVTDSKAHIALFISKKGKLRIESISSRPLEGLSKALEKISSPLIASFTTKDALFGTGEFPTGKPTFMELHIRKAVTETGIIHGPFLLRYHIKDERGNFSQVAYQVLPFQERDRILQYLNPQERPVRGLFTPQVSLAALISQWTNEPAGSVYPAEYGYECTFFQKGSVVYSRTISLAAIQEPGGFQSSMEETLRFLKQNQGFTPAILYAFDEEGLSLLSPLKEAYNVSLAPTQEMLVSDYRDNPVILAPLIGNLLVPPEFNLMDEGYTAELKASQWSKKLYLSALGLSLAILLLTLQQGISLIGLRHQYIQAHDNLQKEVGQILKIQPTEEEIQGMIHFLKLYQAFQHQPKLDRFLFWLSTHAPPRATITQMKVSPGGTQNTPQIPPPAETMPRVTRLQIEIEGKLVGGYYDVKEDFYTFVGDLEKIAMVSNSRFDYGQGEGEFTIKAQYPKGQEEP